MVKRWVSLDHDAMKHSSFLLLYNGRKVYVAWKVSPACPRRLSLQGALGPLVLTGPGRILNLRQADILCRLTRGALNSGKIDSEFSYRTYTPSLYCLPIAC